MMTLGLLLACVEPEDSSIGGKDSEETGIQVDGVTVTATDKETVFRVTWDTPSAADSKVECGTDGSFDHTATGTDSEDGLSHEVLLLLAEGQTWTCHARSTIGSEDWTSDSFEIETPFSPSDLPALTLTSAGGTDLGGYLLVTTSYEDNSWVSIADREGRRVWWERGEADAMVEEAWLSIDGKSLHWNSTGAEDAIHTEALDGSSHEKAVLENSHHDFLPLENGNFAVLRQVHYILNDVDVYGDDLIELAPDGTIVRIIWDTFQDFPVNPDDIPLDEDAWDYSHANSLMYYPDTDTYLISFYYFNSIVGIRGETGELLWVLGGDHGEFTYEGDESEIFARQHSPRLVEGGVLMFNNRDVANSSDDRWSEAAEYAVDWEAKTFSKSWSYDGDKEIYVAVLGNADRQADGSTLVGYGSSGRATQVSPEGDVLWQVDSDLGGPFGFVHLVDEIAGNGG